MQVIRCDDRTDIVKSTLHSYAWDLPNFVDALQGKHHLFDMFVLTSPRCLTI